MITLSRDESASYLTTSGAIGRWSIPAAWDTEVLWSRNGKALLANVDENAGNEDHGHWTVHLLSPASPDSLDLNRAIAALMPLLAQCGIEEGADVVGVSWLGATEVLLASQAPRRASCPMAGAFRLYRVQLSPLRVLESYDEAAALRRFRSLLGVEFTSAAVGDCLTTVLTDEERAVYR